MVRKDTIIMKYQGDTYDKNYNRKCIYNKYSLEKLPIWEYIMIICASFIPIFNIITFIIFLITYYICINNEDNYSIMYKLKGSNFITKFILWTNKIFKYKI